MARARTDVPWIGDIATEHGGLILPLPWDCFKVRIILEVKCVKMGIAVVCHFSVVVPLEQPQ